jgi:hypothetical protein
MREFFSDYFDGELSADDRILFETLLEKDTVFRKDYGSYAAVFNQVRALPKVAVSDSFETRLRARIRQEKPAGTGSWWRDLARVPIRVPLGAAALLLVGFVSYGIVLQTGSRPVPAEQGSVGTDLAASAGVSTDMATTGPVRVDNTRPSFAPNLNDPLIGRTVGAFFSSPVAGRQASPHQFQRDDYGIPLEGPFRSDAFRPVFVRDTAPRAGNASGAVDTSLSE